jgi:hypothetical protein
MVQIHENNPLKNSIPARCESTNARLTGCRARTDNNGASATQARKSKSKLGKLTTNNTPVMAARPKSEREPIK